MIDGVSSNIQALSALGVSQAVTADNIANVNTDGYQTARVTLETGQGGTGVNVQQITRDQSPGSVYYENRPVETGDGGYTQEYTAVEASNVDLAVQMVHMIRDQNAYSANIVAIRTQDELVGSVLDMIA
jgi:flagellar basal-body rod protein FlgC